MKKWNSKQLLKNSKLIFYYQIPGFNLKFCLSKFRHLIRWFIENQEGIEKISKIGLYISTHTLYIYIYIYTRTHTRIHTTPPQKKHLYTQQSLHQMILGSGMVSGSKHHYHLFRKPQQHLTIPPDLVGFPSHCGIARWRLVICLGFMAYQPLKVI